MQDWLTINEEVQAAVAAHLPVLAMESSIIAQGMPWPRNFETATGLCEQARAAGVVPAVIGIVRGMIRVGLDRADIEALAQVPHAVKFSTRNLAAVTAQGELWGGTTVAATMHCAHRAGIRVFATGGIGGVHRSLDQAFDVSADLQQFTRSPVLVVSAGIKAILDIPRTLEMLETLGVPVLGWQTEHFPAFYSADSGVCCERIDTVEAVMRRFILQNRIIPDFGMLLGNPIPRADEIPFAEIDGPIQAALRDLETQRRAGHITGADVTPYLLQKLVDLTAGRSLEANIQLVRNNVALGCELAKAWAAYSGSVGGAPDA